MSDRNQTSLLEQALRLPRYQEMTIPFDYLDANGHMNMMYYSLVGNIGTHGFWVDLGLHNSLERTGGKYSTFMLRQVLSYLNELRGDDRIGVHAGLYNYDQKKLHYFVYIINLDRNVIAAVDERLEISIDMTIRRSAPFESSALAKIQQVYEAHSKLGWQPDLSGAISVGKSR